MTMMNKTVHIACCFDERMELPFLVLANSIKRRLGSGRKVVLHACHCDPLKYDDAFFAGLGSDVFEIRWRRIENPYDHFPAENHLTTAMYVRLMLPILLPDVRRVIYLDTDVVVLTDITLLDDIDLRGSALAATLDYPLLIGALKSSMKVGNQPALEYLTDVVQLTNWRHYFNSGVLVMDLDEFRKKNLVATAEAFIARMEQEIVHPDQDALNHALDGEFVRLDPRWNRHASRSEEEITTMDADFAAVELWKSDPWILHYCSPAKPWNPHALGTPFDLQFWLEAAQCEALPLLVDDYLKRCEQHANTSLIPRHRLLSSGKPALDKLTLMAHARRFAAVPEVSSASLKIVTDLERDHETGYGGSALLPVDVFTHRGGIREGGALVFDLGNANGHVVYGPYVEYPAGNYEAVFDISLSGVTGDEQFQLVIETSANTDQFLAQRSLSAVEPVSKADRTLVFAVTGGDMFLEFRIFAGGFASGTLRFSGVSLKRYDL